MNAAHAIEKPQSFKAAKSDGRLKSREIFRVDAHNVKIEPGFNLREMTPELEEHIESLKHHFLAKRSVPPIEVRLDEKGRVVVVDGYCRTTGLLRALKVDKTLDPMLDCKPFEGDEVERVAKIITSAAGKPLTPLEVAEGYRRLAMMGLTPAAIGERFNKTRQHVDQWLLVANAGTDVHDLIRAGDVSMTLAVDLVRKHGEKAGEIIKGKKSEAEARGKKKVTASTAHGAPKLKPKTWAPVLTATAALFDALPTETKVKLEEAKAAPSQQNESDTVVVPVALLAQLMATHGDVIDARAELDEKERQRQAKAAQGDAFDKTGEA